MELFIGQFALQLPATGLLALPLLFGACTSCHNAAQPVRGLHEVWFASQSGKTGSRPALRGDVVFFGSGDGAVIARTVATGAEVWKTLIYGPTEIQASELIATGDLVIAEGLREVAALNAADGSVRWRFTPPTDTILSGPGYLEANHLTTDGSTLYVPAWGASVSAVDITSGSATWIWRLGRLASDTAANVFRSGAEGAAISGDTLFVTVWHWTTRLGASAEVLLAALDRNTGRQLWITIVPKGAQVASAPIIANDLAVVATVHGEVSAIRRSDQQVVWEFKSAAFRYATHAQPALLAGTLYFDGGDEHLYALRVVDGAVLWSVPSISAARDFLATDRRIYFTNYTELVVHDRATGALVARADVKPDVEAFETAAIASGSQIFVTRTTGAWSFREP